MHTRLGVQGSTGLIRGAWGQVEAVQSLRTPIPASGVRQRWCRDWRPNPSTQDWVESAQGSRAQSQGTGSDLGLVH